MRHEFAFYVEKFSSLVKHAQSGHIFVVQDPELTHRLNHVVRMHQEQSCVLFDENCHAQAVLRGYHGKKSVEFMLHVLEQNQILQPCIIALLPLLKREAFEDACYNLVELGTQVIQPVITQKIHRSWGGAKEMERLRKICIAASEQSKNYRVPKLCDPITFEQVLNYKADALLYCDPEGIALWNAAGSLRMSKPQNIAVMIGPEGDLTEHEKERLAQSGFTFCALTPTILRSYQAISLMVGGLRSLL